MKIGTCDCCEAQNVELSRSELAGLETWSCTEGCPSPDQLARSTDGVEAQLKVRRLETVIRRIHEREWPAGDEIKAAKHARQMWDIADAARQREGF